MNRVAVFVDAGYLFAQGSALLTGQKKQRGEVTLDVAAVLTALTELAERVSGVPLLRIYWYDGTSIGPTTQHTAIAHMAGVKVRLGFVNRAGEQKGVDSLIITDMISLARNRAMAATVGVASLEALITGYRSTTHVLREFDSRLLARARMAIGRDLEPKEKKDLRARFIAHCETRLPRA